MFRCTLLVFCCFCFNVIAQSADLKTQVAKVLAEEHLVGAVWSTIDHDSVLFDAVGYSNRAENIPLLSSNKVHVGSITKTVLAVGVLTLVSAGELSLDASVSDLLPGIRFDNPWQASQPVLVRHLLDHTAGLQDARFWHLFNTSAQADSPLSHVFSIDPALLRVRTEPGRQFSYSNLGYNLLAMVVEVITATRFENALDEWLLQPLGMIDSSFYFTSQLSDSRLAFGHLDQGELIGAVPNYLRAAGGFSTTASDMAVLAQFIMGDGRVNSNVLVDTQLLHRMGQVAATESQLAGLNVGGGHGLWRRDRLGVVGLCHGGNTIGYRGMFCLFPLEKKAFFVMINADSETANYDRINQLMVNHLAIKPAVKPLAQVGNYHQWLGWYQPEVFPFESFTYLDKLFNVNVLSVSDSELIVDNIQTDSLILTPVGKGLFTAHNRSTESHILMRDEQGDLSISNGFQTWRKAKLLPLTLLWMSLTAGFLGALYIFIRGTYLLITRRFNVLSQPVGIAFLMFIGFLVPLPFFFSQTFIQLGDVNAASVSLAIATALSAVLCLYAFVKQYRDKTGLTVDSLGIVAYLQWSLVLGYWGLFPLMLWTL